MKDWKIVKDFCNTYKGEIPKNTIVIYAHKSNDSLEMCTVGGDITDSQREKAFIKWENIGCPDYMTMRINVVLNRARVLNAIFIQNKDNVNKAVTELKAQGKAGADANDLPAALSDMHNKGVGTHIQGMDNDGKEYSIIYSKSADMYDGKLAFKLLDLLPIFIFDIKGDTGAFQEPEITMKQNEPAPEEESFDFTDEALKEMKALGGLG